MVGGHLRLTLFPVDLNLNERVLGTVGTAGTAGTAEVRWD